MPISKDELIDLIAEKVDFDRDQVESEVNQLIQQIREKTGEGESFELEGFGRFYEKEGSLLFDPSDDLSTEMNYKYAGMEPVELAESNKDLPDEESVDEVSEAGEESSRPETEDGEEEKDSEEEPEEGFDAGAAEEEEDVDFEKIFGLSAGASIEEETEEDDDKETPESEQEVQEEAETFEEEEMEPVEDTDEVFSESTDEERSEEKPRKEKESSTEDDSDLQIDEPSEENQPDREEPREEREQVAEEESTSELDIFEEEEKVGSSERETRQTEKSGEEQKTQKRRKTRSRRNRSFLMKLNQKFPIIPLLIISVSIVVLGFGFWIITSPDMRENVGDLIYGSESTTAVKQEKAQPVAPENEASDENTAANQAGESENEQATPIDEGGDDAGEPTDEVVQKQAARQQEAGKKTEPYGLFGSWYSEGTSYTLIIYSFKERSYAEEVIENMQEAGYRMHIHSAIVDGNRYYRVAVGQFRSIEAAQQAASKLDARHRENFFIRNISNS